MFKITAEPIDLLAVRAAVLSPKCGALIIFEGTTRNHHDDKAVVRLSYEAYTDMAVNEFRRIAAQAQENWGPCNVAIVHRVGEVPAGETSIIIAVSAPHRDSAYQASRYAIDALKQTAPIWKKEIYGDGSTWKANPST
jgi:molybdopterin synthase catalytic subunit